MAQTKDIVWPPETVQDVLNLTPRKSRFAHINPPMSPSPLRNSPCKSAMERLPPDLNSEEDEEDEETLQLKLAQIEAKLRLKRLQKKKASEGSSSSSDGVGRKAEVQVPHSPTRKPLPPPSPKSPSRILLGIDKGLTGRDVSLRRAPALRNGNHQLSNVTSARKQSPPRLAKSFSQRIADERARDRSKAERQKLVSQSRSKGFGLENDVRPSTASAIIANISREQHSNTRPSSSYIAPTRTADSSSFVPTNRSSFSSEKHASFPSDKHSSFTSEKHTSFNSEENDSTDEAGFDSFSGMHLARRITPHTTVSRYLSSKIIFQLPHLLKSIVAPNFEPPDVVGDYIVVGVICNKSDPRDVGQNTQAKKTGQKYMVMQLTDLKWEVELFLFGSGFDRFRKLPVGTIIAILNPGIMKPRNADTGRFSLTLNDDGADSVIEIGMSRDLGFCKALKRDQKECASWIDKRHTHYCAFHVEQTVKKARVGRAEVSSIGRLFSPGKNGAPRPPPRKFLGRGGDGGKSRDDGLLREGPMADLPARMGGAGGNVFVNRGRSTASLLDDEDYCADGSGLHRASKEERLRKRLVEAKKERELTKRLIEAQGREGGIGTTYLQSRLNNTGDKAGSGSENEAERKQVSEALSALRSKPVSAAAISLSPVKRKRSQTVGSVAAPSPVPVAKKTRFALETPADSDDDDDLDIIHE